jgi:hypothetical protein
LEEAGDLHRFLRDLDHFQAWLTKTQTDVASEDTPASLAEAEKLLNQHQSIREEIDNYTDDYAKMMEYGERITAVSNFHFYLYLYDPSSFFSGQLVVVSEGGEKTRRNSFAFASFRRF